MRAIFSRTIFQSTYSLIIELCTTYSHSSHWQSYQSIDFRCFEAPVLESLSSYQQFEELVIHTSLCHIALQVGVVGSNYVICGISSRKQFVACSRDYHMISKRVGCAVPAVSFVSIINEETMYLFWNQPDVQDVTIVSFFFLFLF